MVGQRKSAAAQVLSKAREIVRDIRLFEPNDDDSLDDYGQKAPQGIIEEADTAFDYLTGDYCNGCYSINGKGKINKYLLLDSRF